MKTSDKFFEYLLCTLPDGYPIDSVRISLDMTESHRKELVFQQFKFIQLAQDYIDSMPWIAYIAIMKHKLILDFFKTSTVSFKEILDKEYFDKTQALAERLDAALSLKLDDETKHYCERLVLLQVMGSSIVKTQMILDNALELGIRSFEPQLKEPTLINLRTGWFFTGLIILCAAVSIAENPDGSISGLGMAILIVGVVGYIGFTYPANKKNFDAKQQFKRYNTLRNDYYGHANGFMGLLDLDAEALAHDLLGCRATLTSLIEELEALKATYVEAYIQTP